VAARSKMWVWDRSVSGIGGFESRRGHRCLCVPCKCFVLSGIGLYVGLISRPEESYRVWSWSLENREGGGGLPPPYGLLRHGTKELYVCYHYFNHTQRLFDTLHNEMPCTQHPSSTSHQTWAWTTHCFGLLIKAKTSMPRSAFLPFECGIHTVTCRHRHAHISTLVLFLFTSALLLKHVHFLLF
jgi:hypothetical protein